MRRLTPFLLAATALLVAAVPAMAAGEKCTGQGELIGDTSVYWNDAVALAVNENRNPYICVRVANNGTVTYKDDVEPKEKIIKPI